MALDKLVDSTILNACCTAEANAIRAKTGGSAQLTYDWANSKGFADAIAAISGGINFKTGTYIPSETYSSGGNREITTVSALGFTPKKFIIGASDRSAINTTQYALIVTVYEEIGSTPLYARHYTRYQNTSGTLGQAGNLTSWTTRVDNCLYLNDGVIYWRTSSNGKLIKDVEYVWYAYGS